MLNQKLEISLARCYPELMIIQIHVNGCVYNSDCTNNPQVELEINDKLNESYELEIILAEYSELFYQKVLQERFTLKIGHNDKFYLSSQSLQKNSNNYVIIQTSSQQSSNLLQKNIKQNQQSFLQNIRFDAKELDRQLVKLNEKLKFEQKSQDILSKIIVLQARKILKHQKQEYKNEAIYLLYRAKQGTEVFSNFEIRKSRIKFMDEYKRNVNKSLVSNMQNQIQLETGEVIFKTNDQQYALIHLFNPIQKRIFLLNKINYTYTCNNNVKDEPFYFDQNNVITNKYMGQNKSQIFITNIDTNQQQINTIDFQQNDRTIVFKGYIITFCNYKMQNYLIKYKEILKDIPVIKKTNVSSSYTIRKKFFSNNDSIYFLMQLKDIKEKVYIGKFSVSNFDFKVVNEVKCDDANSPSMQVNQHFNKYIEFSYEQIVYANSLINKTKSKDLMIKFNNKKAQPINEKILIAANKYFFNEKQFHEVEIISATNFTKLQGLKIYKSTNLKNKIFDPSEYVGYKFLCVSDGSLFIYCRSKYDKNFAFCFVYTKKYIIQVKSPLIYYEKIQLLNIENFIYLYVQEKGLIQVFDCLLGDWIQNICIQKLDENFKITQYKKNIAFVQIDKNQINIIVLDKQTQIQERNCFQLCESIDVKDFHLFYLPNQFGVILTAQNDQKYLAKFDKKKVLLFKIINYLDGNILKLSYFQNIYYILISKDQKICLLSDQNINQLKTTDSIDQSLDNTICSENEYCIYHFNSKEHLSRILYFRYTRNNSLNFVLDKKLLITSKDKIMQYDVNHNTLNTINNEKMKFPINSQCLFDSGNLYFVGGKFQDNKTFNGIFIYNIYTKEKMSFQFEEIKNLQNFKCLFIDDKLVVLGGSCINQKANQNNYFLDLKTRRLCQFAQMIQQRQNFEIINLHDSIICLFGESDNKILTTIECFDKKQYKFRTLYDFDEIGFTKFNIVKYSISKYLIFGGYNLKNEPNFNFYLLEFFDETQITITPLQGTNFTNIKADLCFIYNKRLMIYGKINAELNIENLNDIIVVNKSLDLYQNTNYQNIIQYEINQKQVQQNHQSMLLFHPDKNRIFKISKDQIQIIQHNLENIYKSSEICYIEKNKFLLAGGLKQDNKTITNEAYLLTYEKEQLIKRSLPPMKNFRFTFSMIYNDNQIYVIGGRTADSVISECEKYDLNSKKWISIASLNQARSTASVTIYKNRIYIFGGYTGKGRASTIECYDRIMNQWEVINTLPILPFDGSSLMMISSQEFLLFGGKTDLGLHEKVYYYNFESDIWDNFTTLNQKQNLTKCGKFGNTLLLYNSCEKSSFDQIELPFSRCKVYPNFVNAYLCSKQKFTNTYYVNF